MTDELVKQWDEYVESMGSVMGEVEHMAQQMRDRIEQLTAERDSLLAGHRILNIDGARLETRIEKLTGEVQRWQGMFDEKHNLMLDHKARAEKAEAENARLRETLENIIKDYEPGYPLSHDVIKYVARSALKGEMP